LYPLMEVWADSFMAVHKDVQITITTSGTGEGLHGLKTEKYDLAMVSSRIEDPDTTGEFEFIPVGQDVVIPITNRNNPYLQVIEQKGITPELLLELFTKGEKVSWGKILDTTYRNEAVVYTRYDESGTADIWAGLFWKKQTDLKGLPAMGEDEMIRRIQSTPLGIGYCNLVNACEPVTGKFKENIAIVPFDLDFDRIVDIPNLQAMGLKEFHKIVWPGRYPKTLCRKLTVAVKTEDFNPLINNFLVYILTKGQKYVSLKGYYPLNESQLRNSYILLEEANRVFFEQSLK